MLKKIVYLFRYFKNWLMIEDRDRYYLNAKSSQNIVKSVSLVFVHGFADKPGTFNDLIESIMPDLPATVSSVLNVSCTGRKKSIASLAESLIIKIKKHKSKDIILIGHSRGGIISAYAAEYLARVNNISIRGVIAIASPFQGSHLVKYPATVLVKSLEEMSVKSDLLNDLNTVMQMNKYQHRYLFITSGKDLIVQPLSTYLNVPYSKHVTLQEYGHLSIMQSPELQQCIIEAIKEWISDINEQVTIKTTW